MNVFKKNVSGFTLIEIVLVVIIIGIIVAMAIPNFSRTYDNMRLKQTVDRVSYLMKYAQARAIAKSRDHRLEYDPEQKTFWVTQSSVESSGLTEQVEEEIFQRVKNRMGRKISVGEGIVVESEKSSSFESPMAALIYPYHPRFHSRLCHQNLHCLCTNKKSPDYLT